MFHFDSKSRGTALQSYYIGYTVLLNNTGLIDFRYCLLIEILYFCRRNNLKIKKQKDGTIQENLLKLSGESLMGGKQYGIDEVRLNEYAAQIKEIAEMGVQIGIVIGGGNIFRGLSGASKGFDRVKGDQMGMLATVINSLALSSALVAQA